MSVCDRRALHMHRPCVSDYSPQELSVLDDPKEQKGNKVRGQNPNAGWYNRFVQTGKSDHETKSNGAFGGHLCIMHHTGCRSSHSSAPSTTHVSPIV